MTRTDQLPRQPRLRRGTRKATAGLDLAEFVRARLDDDERTAERCCYTDQPWIGLVDFRGAHYLGLSCARVRADVHAKRQIVRLHAACGTGTGRCDEGGPEGIGCATLAYLAVPYAAHRDYRPEWRP
ncbi:DUF6221 family protein [Petropleomorpha daqingensis]|uniref:Uncharacterized protein n=1 Tax=Petropleomorpha daqingensis TaxID=2026353 RepID=A0A853CIA8_9ACTN|nr:hypothetical protein [Petropleomorpha daqingensis]